MTLPLSVIQTEAAPKAIGPYSQAIRAGAMIYTAGQIPLNPETGTLVEGGIEIQTHQALDNLARVLEAAGSGLSRVVKTTVFMQDLGEFAAMNAVYGEYFTANPPARSTIQAAALPRGAKVEIECIAVVND
jgi:2-iminobutanoate/2-iminopropanoate deaminase